MLSKDLFIFSLSALTTCMDKLNLHFQFKLIILFSEHGFLSSQEKSGDELKKSRDCTSIIKIVHIHYGTLTVLSTFSCTCTFLVFV